MSAKQISIEILKMVRTMPLSNEETAAIVERLVNSAVRDGEQRVVAELEGWKAIATELLSIAFGEKNELGDGVLPPMEIIELRAAGKLPPKLVPALEQFWRDLTLKHQAAREAKHDEGE